MFNGAFRDWEPEFLLKHFPAEIYFTLLIAINDSNKY